METSINEVVNPIVENEDIDSIDVLFVPQGAVDIDIEWSKWMKQQPALQSIRILDYWKATFAAGLDRERTEA